MEESAWSSPKEEERGKTFDYLGKGGGGKESNFEKESGISLQPGEKAKGRWFLFQPETKDRGEIIFWKEHPSRVDDGVEYERTDPRLFCV